MSNGVRMMQRITYGLRFGANAPMFRSIRSVAALLPTAHSALIFATLERFAFLYRAAKNIANLSRYTQFCLSIFVKYYQIHCCAKVIMSP
ncbi:MAG: hypothetical protein Ta2A_10310 [Treponemataceae bacterium]|nr:MAG: hypothetical protein Ta2A_10310 [Treponemataceae bacterium]